MRTHEFCQELQPIHDGRHGVFSSHPGGAVSLLVLFATAALFIAGCSSSISSSTPPAPDKTTTVNLLATSTANDQLTGFDLDLLGVTLTTQSGTSVNLLPGGAHVEFSHLNGSTEPLAELDVPQGAYTSAKVTVGDASFTCVSGNSAGTNTTDHYLFEGYTLSDAAEFSSPITITGESMGLSLDLLVSQSASFPFNCANPGTKDTFGLSPTFSFTAEPAVALRGLEGVVSSVDAGTGSFTVSAADNDQTDAAVGPNLWQLNTGASTSFEGIPGVASLTVGMAINLDAAPQPDGSLLATRIEVDDADPTDLTLSVGPLMEVISFEPTLMLLTQGASGTLWDGGGQEGASAPFSYDQAVFGITSQLSNLQSLPFTPSFTAQNMVAGQNVATTSHATVWGYAPSSPELATVTLLPQTINGTVTAISGEGAFQAYTVTLAPYDAFPQLAVQPTYQTTLLTDPSTAVVYADSNVQSLNTQPIAVGSLMRFYGLVFNDSGTLRMDCARILDGVKE